MCVHTHSISCDPVVSTVRIIFVYPYTDSCRDLSDHRCSFTTYYTTVLTQMEYAAATWSHQTVTPEISFEKHVFVFICDSCNTASKCYLIGQPTAHFATTLRVRGGAGDPSSDKIFNEIPYLTNIRFEWDGLPSIDFQERVLNQLDNGLGSVLQSGATLLQTVNERDPGGRLGNPLRAAAPANIIEESDLRNTKAFSCILNYVNSNSSTYKMFMRNFVGNGIAAYRYITIYGPLPTPQKVIQAREDTWIKMTMDVIKIPYTIKGYFRWVEIVSEQGRLLGKNGNLQKAKLLSGFPEFFASTVNNMARDNGHLFPALYGGLPAFVGSPIAANAHPDAGRCNITSLARAYLADWVNGTSKLAKHVPDGLIRSLDVFSLEDTEIANLLAKDVTPDTKCYLCGGDGHAASQKLDNGDMVICAKKALESQKSGASGSINLNTRGDKHSLDKAHYQKQVNQLETEVHELRYELQKAMRLKTTPTRESRRRNSAPTAHELEDESDDLKSADACSKSDGVDDDDDDDSGGSYIPSFAEVAQPFKRRPKSPVLRRTR